MKTTIKFDRRSFIKVSVAAGGGVMIGFNWLASCTSPATEAAAIPEEWFDVNAFLKIAENGIVTIMAPNPEIGQGVKTSMPMIVAEELDIAWKDVIVEQAPLDTDNYRRQVAGGSQSIRQGWESLRMAGASARKMLLDAAAKSWEVDPSECTTDNGKVLHKASGKSMGYGEIVAAGLELSVPEEVDLKDPKDFKIIGQPIKNVDNKEIITGKPLYGMDFKREGMLIAMITHRPAFGLKLKSVDDSKAKAMPGIKHVVQFDDQVAVVGNSFCECKKAKDALNIEWEEDSALENTEDHEKILAELNQKPQDKPVRKDGDPNQAFGKAARVIERTYDAPFLAHNPMAPMNFFADVRGDKIELVGPIQTPQSTRGRVAKKLNVPEENISIDMTRMGGGFGRRLYGHFAIEAAQISQLVKAPVKLIYTREDDMTQGTYRPSYKVTYRAALDKNNNLLGLHIRGAGINGKALFPNRFPAGAIDHYLAESHIHESNITTGAWRAPISNFIGFAEQSFIDEIAEEMGRDPIELRLEWFERAKNNPVGENNDYDPERYAGVLKLVREKSNWDQPEEGIYRGVSAYYSHNSYVAQVAEVAMEGGKPKVKKVYCAVDCGIVINESGAKNQVEGATIDGIGHAMFSKLTFKNGKPEQNNFDRYRLIRINEAPDIETHFVQNGIAPTGLGEPALPPIAAAVANAIFKATGTRVTKQPFVEEAEILG